VASLAASLESCIDRFLCCQSLNYPAGTGNPAIMGVFHKASEKYSRLYLNEFAYRFNKRHEFNLMDKVLSECF